MTKVTVKNWSGEMILLAIRKVGKTWIAIVARPDWRAMTVAVNAKDVKRA